LIALGISLIANVVLLNNLRTWKPKRGRQWPIRQEGCEP
jgi:hypothetical protein